LRNDRNLIEEIAGIMLVLLGLFFLLTPFVTRINREWRPEGLLIRAGSGGPIIAGAAFAVGWTPCTGPILGAILTTAAERNGDAVVVVEVLEVEVLEVGLDAVTGRGAELLVVALGVAGIFGLGHARRITCSRVRRRPGDRGCARAFAS